MHYTSGRCRGTKVGMCLGHTLALIQPWIYRKTKSANNADIVEMRFCIFYISIAKMSELRLVASKTKVTVI